MPRLIDANEALELFRVNYANTERLIKLGETQLDSLAEGYTEAAHIIKHILPSVDAVPVVRCKDCEHTYESFRRLVCDHGVCKGCTVREDFFCADGVKREEAKRNEKTD